MTGVYILKDSDIIMVSAHKLPHTRHGPRATAELGRGKKRKIQEVTQRVFHLCTSMLTERKFRAAFTLKPAINQVVCYTESILTLKFFSIKNSSHR